MNAASRRLALPLVAPAHSADGCVLIRDIRGLQGDPALVVICAGDGLSAKMSTTQHWVAMSADTLAQARLQAGEVVLVGLSDQVSAPPAPMGSPISLFAPTSAPLATVPSTALRLQSLAMLCGRGYRVQLKEEPTGSQGSTKDADDNPAPELPGHYLVAARVWPASRLARGTAALSAAVSECCGGAPDAGALLLLFRPSQLRTQAAAAAVAPQQVCSAVTLRLCQDLLRAAPAALLLASAATSGAHLRSAAEPSTPSRAAGKSSSGRGAPASPSAPSSTYGDTDDASGGGSRAAAITADWATRLLSEPLGQQERALLCRVASRHLEGRLLLPGNLLLLPILGRLLFFRVLHLELHATSGVSSTTKATSAALGGPGPVSLHESDLSGGLVDGTSTLSLLWPGEPLPAGLDEFGRLRPDATAQDTSSSAVKQRGSAALVASAREAAAVAVPGSSQEAAVAAAERAVLCGLSGGPVQLGALGGVSSYLPSLRDLVTLPLTAPHLFTRYGLRPPRGLLLHGPPGSGKTLLARAAAAAAGAVLLVVNGPDVMTEFVGESEAGLQGIFAAARALAPAVIFIDEVDALAPARGGDGGSGGSMHGAGAAGEASSRLVTALLTLMDGVNTGPSDRVVVIGATNRRAALDGALRRPGRLEREIEVGAPSPADRQDILQARLRSVRHSLTVADVASLAAAAHGFVAADLSALVDEAAMCALRRRVMARQMHEADTQGLQQQQQQQQPLPSASAAGSPPLLASDELLVTPQDFRVAETRVRPSALREVAIEIPRVTWRDVGGLDEVKQRLQEAVEWPLREAAALVRVGAVPPRGVLLYGPPGCSKTLLARAVAHEAGLNFISIKGGELFSKYVGDSERAVAALFARARASAPAIIFFDEIDALAAARSADGAAGVGERVLSQLLSEMDGLQTVSPSSTGSGTAASTMVVVVAATNRPDRVDVALLRPGRFDRLLYVAPPDEASRAEIFRVHLRRTPVGDDVDVQRLAAATSGMTGADAAALCREASLAALEESLSSQQVCWRHFERAMALVSASAPISGAMLRMYALFQRQGRV